MPRTILLDELHLSVVAPCGLRKAEFAAIVRTLRSARFKSGLRQAVRGFVARHPSLRRARFTIAR
jgi:hypothetical protein